MSVTEDYRWWDLATYNAEKARGLVHTPEWVEKMAALQTSFDAEQDSKRRADGWTPIYRGGECVGWVKHTEPVPSAKNLSYRPGLST